MIVYRIRTNTLFGGLYIRGEKRDENMFYILYVKNSVTR